MTRLNRGAVVAAGIAASLGAASAAMSAYWALGGTALLDTVGGEIESWGRERSASVGATLWLITIAKLAAAVAPLVLVGVGARRLPAWTSAQPMRVLGWVVAIGLTAYGSVLTVVGLLVEADVIDAADNADERAIAWHAFFWDPWFALWGGAFTVAMWHSRPQASDTAGNNATAGARERRLLPVRARPQQRSLIRRPRIGVRRPMSPAGSSSHYFDDPSREWTAR